MSTRAEEIAEQVENLPSPPDIVFEIQRLIRDPDTEVGELVQAVSRDQVLVTRILRLANSAYYGFPRQIASLHQAVILLGFERLGELVLAVSTYPFFEGEMAGYGLEAGRLWEHALTCARCSRLVSEQIGYSEDEQAFITGLIHDIGKVVLDCYVHDEYEEIWKEVEGGRSFASAENEILGFSHAEVGALVADRWKLPHGMVDAIRHHHAPRTEPAEGSDHRLESMIHVADVICIMLGFGLGSDGLYYPLEDEALELLGIDRSAFRRLYAATGELAREDAGL